MAVFNPQVQPTHDPNFLNYSRVVEGPAADTSVGQIFKGLGEGLAMGVKAVDDAIKLGIDNKAYAMVDKERDTMTEALEVINKQSKNTVPAPAQGVGGGKVAGSILDANAMALEEEVPPGLEQGLDRVNLLSAARNAAKINDTQYSGQVLSIAKQLRSEYGPGYRDYIDQRVSAASGLPVANSYYGNLISDINRQLTSVGKAKDGSQALYLKNLDVKDIQQYWSQLQKGEIPESTFISKISEYRQWEAKLKTDAAKRAESTDNKKTVADQTQLDWDTSATDAVTQKLSSIVDLGGNKTKVSDLVDHFSKVSTGEIKEDPTATMARKQQLDAIINDQKVFLRAKAAEGGKNSVIATIGTKAVNDSIEKALYPLQVTATFAGNKEDGPAYLVARQVELIKADAPYQILINKDTTKEARVILGARTIAGEAWAPALFPSIVSKDIDTKFNGLLTQESLAVLSDYTDQRGKPLPRSMKQAIEHAKEIGAPETSGLYKAYTNIPNWITDPKLSDAAKDRVIDWAFDPKKNKGVLNHLKPDYVDPNTNTLVEGKHTAFNKLASPAMVDSVAETAKAKPENYKKYMTTLEGEYSTIFRSDIQSINVVTSKVPNVGFSWDSSGRLGLVDKRTGMPVVRNERYMGAQYPQGVYLNTALDTIARVNAGLERLSYAQSKDPSGARDTSLYAFNVLRENRANEDLLRAIIKSKAPDTPMSPAKVQPTQKMPAIAPMEFSQTLREEPENPGPSVKQFMANPTGQPVSSRRSRAVGPNEEITSIRDDRVPDGMDIKDFIAKLKREGRY